MITSILQAAIAVLIIPIVGILVSAIVILLLNIGKTFDTISIKIKRKDDKLVYELEEEKLHYSTQLLDYTKKFIADYVVLRFSSFKDAHDLAKLTEQQTKNLINDIANDIHKYLDVITDTNSDKITFSEEYYDVFIVNTIIIMVKDLTNKAIDAYDGYSS
jgi:hypothetical protein